MMRTYIAVLSALLFFNSILVAQKRPNVVIVMTDDQGYGDVSAHGNPVLQTPEIDRLHKESVRLTNFHVDPTCAPSRSAIMTGKYSHHVAVWHTINGGNHLRRTETTMAEVFKHNGYQTAMFGKWHLGANYPYRPMDRGFEEWWGLGDGGPGTTDDYFWNDRVNDTYWHNGEREYAEGFNPDVFFSKAIDYVKNRDKDKPFFMYLPTYAPHKPYTLPDANLTDKHTDNGLKMELAGFYSMIEIADRNLGKLRKTLDDEKIAENTVFIFLTDNGSSQGRKSFNAGMSGAKGSNMEGGHRVPCFIYWPKGNLGKPRDINTLTAHIDLLPTLTELCKMELPKEIDFDGTSLTSLFKKKKQIWEPRTLFVEGQRRENYKKGARSAVMTQEWRLLEGKKLYDIVNDPAQKINVAKEHPEVVDKLNKEFDKYWALVTPNDRVFPLPIVGTAYDKEILLGFGEMRKGGSFYHHGNTAKGQVTEGVWHLETAESGKYEFEVARWPKESGSTIVGVPRVTKTVDAWWQKRPKTHILNANSFIKLPISFINLIIGNTYNEIKEVSSKDKSITFEVSLPKGKTTVDSRFLNRDKELITRGYYVYVRKK